jgi:hypothetical protein
MSAGFGGAFFMTLALMAAMALAASTGGITMPPGIVNLVSKTSS